MATNQSRIARLDWHPDILAIERAAQQLPWSEAILKSCFSESYYNLGYWSADGELLGFALVQTVADCWTIMNIVTKPSAQRQGIGQQLLQYIQQRADQQQANIVLEVRVSNQPALGLYQRCGFTEIGRRKDYYASSGQSREDALVMRWTR